MAFSLPDWPEAGGKFSLGRGLHRNSQKPATPPPVVKGFSAQGMGFAWHLGGARRLFRLKPLAKNLFASASCRPKLPAGIASA